MIIDVSDAVDPKKFEWEEKKKRYFTTFPKCDCGCKGDAVIYHYKLGKFTSNCWEKKFGNNR